MFSLQMADILSAAGGTVRDLAKALQTKLGNCAQPLEHRGPVTITTTLPDKSTAAALTLQNNFPGQATAFPGSLAGFDGKTPDGSNGFALNVQNGIAQFQGPIWPLFRPNWIKFVLLEDLAATPGTTASIQIVDQQPNSANTLIGTTATLTNDIGYWSGSSGDAGEANIWYTDLANDVYEWRPRVIKASGSSGVTDDAAATCVEASCKPYFFTLAISGLGSGGTCEELNGKTLLLTYSSACVWKVDGLGLGGTCGYDEARLTVTDNGADTRLTVTFYNASNTLQATAYYDIAATDPANLCTGPWTSWTWSTAGPPPVVTGPPTMTLTPYYPPQLSDSTCSCCPDSKVPASYTVTISGVTNNGCDGCSAWNTTYVLTRDNSFNCYYSGQFNITSGTTPCDTRPSWLEWMSFYPCLGSLSAYGRDTLGSNHFNATFTVPASCWDYFNEPATAITDVTTACTASGATITISANF